ncbi:MAG: DUF3427 domain-containing protein [Deltaproteobacteria bacterium]|nr:DUF3427 domain-containing protein [Deltaproteobacteria bacterium]
MPACPFCSPAAGRVFHDEGDPFVCLWDAFPVSHGHALVITRRHVATWFEATLEERAALVRGIDVAQQVILARHSPAGFNIGINVGAAGGQTVGHLHVHVIPRYAGDVPNPRGGVRGVIPWQADYPTAEADPAPPGVGEGPQLAEPPRVRPSISGGGAVRAPRPRGAVIVGSDSDPLLPHLLKDLSDCRALDLAVAFVLPSGLNRIHPYLQDILDRDGRIRLLTGDYMAVTDPVALSRLLDLQDRHQPAPRLDCRVFVTDSAVGFHPKVYVIHDRAAYVGSSNLTQPALERGVEWNYRVEPAHDRAGFEAAVREFEGLFRHPKTRPLTEEWIREYAARRVHVVRPAVAGLPSEPPAPPPAPHTVQVEALAALERTRRDGNNAGLVVLATGLGKTWLSAFDSRPFRRVLFVAHREEILNQAQDTYRRIRPSASLGHFSGEVKDRNADVLFASIQTLARRTHLETFPRDHFDYMVVDEFHHATAATYRRLLAHFAPKFLLGLTATPERTDGGDLLALCRENLVYRCDVLEGIRRGLLCPFHYFGVPDEVDYANIPWKSGRFDPEKLETAVATQRRAANALEQWREHAGTGARTLAFCVSQRHAEFMKDYFRQRGVRAVAVHAGAGSDPRARSLESLEAGDLDVVFCVDMFNEGVDLPSVDAILMLRPTESRILWLQQVGRGLRKKEDKTLRIVDYIGNHRTFLQGAVTLLPMQDETPAALVAALKRLEEGDAGLPEGCAITYDLRAIEILRALIPSAQGREAVRAWYEDFRDRHGARPTASEAWHAGYDPGTVRRHDGSWLGFVLGMGDLAPRESIALAANRDFFADLETTPMTRSYKMLLLQAWIEQGSFPGTISIDALVRATGEVIRGSATLLADVGGARATPAELRQLLETNPIKAWTAGKGTTGGPYFTYQGAQLASRLNGWGEHGATLRTLTREMVEWRLAQYLGRQPGEADETAVLPGGSSTTGGLPNLWQEYLRASIPGLWGLPFPAHLRQHGFVQIDKHIFLLVTLEKKNLPEEHRYADRFLGPDRFEWQSQNQTSRSSKPGQNIRDHRARGIQVHLFVRRTSKTQRGTASPFTCCGDLEFLSWEGDRPITVQWKLLTPVPDRLWRGLGVPTPNDGA